MKAIKMVLPVTAILFAVVAAFATTTPKSLAKVEISIRGGICKSDGFCTDGGTAVCTYQNNGITFLDDYVTPTPVCNPYSALATWSSN
jgi:hypothetical protein